MKSLGIMAAIACLLVLAACGAPKSDLKNPPSSALKVTLSASSQSGTMPLVVQFAATTNSTEIPLTFAWDFGDGTTLVDSATVTHTYSEAGTYIAKVTATDENGVQDTALVTIEVLADLTEPDNQPPTISLAVSEASGFAPLAVTFTAIAHDPDGDSLSYLWDFGVGDEPYWGAATQSTSYDAPGTFEASVTVNDGRGGIASATAQIIVESDQPPTDQGSELLLFGEDNANEFTVYLGCLSCRASHPESVHNQHGLYGSSYGTASIFNQFGSYGSKYSSKSVCNSIATDPPIVVNQAGNYYGRLTLNRFHPEAITDPELRAWLDAVVCQ